MSGNFVETGQTFTDDDGAAFCPVEQRGRGPLALLASMSVLLAGAAFLAFAVISTPTPIETLPAAHTAKVGSEPSPTQPTQLDKTNPPEKVTLTVEEALAKSRAARALPGQADIETGLTPRLKPVVAAAVSAPSKSEQQFSPRLKPTLASPIKPVVEALGEHLTPLAKPVFSGSVQLASADLAPPSVFFESDVSPHIIAKAHAPTLYANDIDIAPDELRITIERGETFVDALRRAGVRTEDRNAAAYAFGDHYNLRQLRPGQTFDLTVSRPNQTLFQLVGADADHDAFLMGLDFRADAENKIKLSRQHDGSFSAKASSIPLTTRTKAIVGRINGSLYLSAKAQGAPDGVIANLADAFSYDVDFQREIFGGDEFEAIFEAKYDDQGRLISSGDILFARLNWRGRSKEKGYYRYTENGRDKPDFYDATGQSAKRLLMKTPIDGARLSSGFGTRKHPILGYRRAHKGLDFAASRGTPIKAAGDGVIERANRYGSFGNYIRIRHANGYQTAYAHLNGFARGIRSGKRVQQGDIIGYVGTTGRSTGPHLHYEVHLNGSAVNPQRLKIATGKKLTGAEFERFQLVRQAIDLMRLSDDDAGTGLLAKDSGADESAL